jgi:hypothetical protein
MLGELLNRHVQETSKPSQTSCNSIGHGKASKTYASCLTRQTHDNGLLSSVRVGQGSSESKTDVLPSCSEMQGSTTSRRALCSLVLMSRVLRSCKCALNRAPAHVGRQHQCFHVAQADKEGDIGVMLYRLPAKSDLIKSSLSGNADN